MANLSLYFIRHGLAGEHDSYADDAQRPLTEEGHKKTRQVAKKLQELGLDFDLLQTSPLTRAMQTAEIFQNVSDLSYPVQVTASLAPNGNFNDWLAWFVEWQKSGHTSLGLVGHEPDLSAWAELLVWGEVKSSIVLKKAGIIGLAIPKPATPVGESLLFLLMPPKLLLGS